jgi:hypothetical protein
LAGGLLGTFGATVPTPGGLPQMAGGSFHGGVPPTLPHGAVPVGRDLSAYRAAPVMFAARAPGLLRRN